MKNHFEIMEEIFNIMPYVFWKDRQGKYLGCNLNHARAFNFSSISEFVGKTIYDVLVDVESAKLVEATDNDIMDNGKVVILEETLHTPKGVKTYLSQKQPIYGDKGTVIGLLGFAMDITQIKDKERMAKEETEKEQKRFQEFVAQLLHVINSYRIKDLNYKLGKAQLDNEGLPIELTKREREVLYFLSYNKSPKEIASILSNLEEKPIAPKTVQAVIDKQLYPKFNVYSTGELIERAHMYNLVPFLLAQYPTP